MLAKHYVTKHYVNLSPQNLKQVYEKAGLRVLSQDVSMLTNEFSKS